jgi:hypothetical protein
LADLAADGLVKDEAEFRLALLELEKEKMVFFSEERRYAINTMRTPKNSKLKS